MLDTIALIPARSSSKGVRDKNIKRLNNHPLIAYAIKAAQKVKAIQRVFVSTDSEPYAKIAKEYGAEVPFLRPPELSEDDSTDIEWVQHTLQKYSHLEVDVEDTATILMECECDGRTLPVTLTLDYLQKPPDRNCIIVGDRGRIIWDFHGGPPSFPRERKKKKFSTSVNSIAHQCLSRN
jgi:2-C-methyl-D-erythritol 4-phosphate cytidylyltransferase